MPFVALTAPAGDSDIGMPRLVVEAGYLHALGESGTLPLILATGAGAETRQVIGIVVFGGVTVAMLFTLFVVPVVYLLLSGAHKVTVVDGLPAAEHA